MTDTGPGKIVADLLATAPTGLPHIDPTYRAEALWLRREILAACDGRMGGAVAWALALAVAVFVDETQRDGDEAIERFVNMVQAARRARNLDGGKHG